MTDVLTDDVVDLLGDDSHVEPVADGDKREDLFVCDVVVDGAVCGATFSDANRLRLHGLGKHRDRSQDRKGPKTAKAKTAPKSRTVKERAPSRAASTAAGPSTNRSATYAASIAMVGLGAFLVIPPFDNSDLAVVNAGAPNLGKALDDLGSQNETVRKTCDLILGGGSGGAYLQLVLALSAIVVPICAHHGVLPETAGERFGAMIGGPPASPPTVPSTGSPAPESEPEARVGNLDPTNPDDVFSFMSRVPETVMFDLAGRMLGGNPPPTVVEIPFMQPDDGSPTGDDSGGPEQLRPRQPASIEDIDELQDRP